MNCRCGELATKEAREYGDKVKGVEQWEPLCDGHASAAEAMAYEVRPLDDAEDDIDLGTCPYFARWYGLPTGGMDALCTFGCRDEPECVTMILCRPCHRWAHDNPSAAIAEGWIVRAGIQKGPTE